MKRVKRVKRTGRVERWTGYGYVKVARPPLAALGLVAPLALATWSGKPLIWEGLMVAGAVFFGNLGYTMLNEAMDWPVDAKNKPHKPIPSGLADPNTVVSISRLSILLSAILLVLLSAICGIFYLVGFVGLVCSAVYNVLRKDLAGNLCMASAYGVAALVSLWPWHLLFVPAFALWTLGFNLAVQWQDLAAERSLGVVTAPQQLRRGGTAFVGSVISGVAFVLFARIYASTAYLPLAMFLAASGTNTLSLAMVAAVPPGSWVQEALNRYAGRILIMAGYLWMILGG